MRRAQIWSIDLALSLLIFLLAVALTYNLMVGTAQGDAHDIVREQAVNAAGILASDGYPEHWIQTDVIRAGIVADGQVSVRKARLLQELPVNDLRAAMRMTDSYVLYALNASGVVPIFGTCAIGDAVPSGTPQVRTLPSLAVVRGSHPVADATGFDQDATDTFLSTIANYDVLLLEGNLSESALTPAQMARALDAASRRGITIIVIGNPDVGALGISPSYEDVSTLTVQPDGTILGLDDGETLTLSAPPQTIATIGLPSGSAVTDATVLALTDGGDVAYATWIYNDARIYYLATTDGLRDDASDLTAHIGGVIDGIASVDWPECPEPTLPDAEEIAHHERTIPYHDDLLLLRAVVWRS